VTDKEGSVVENLGKDDFEILEDGRRQQIDFFSRERIEIPSTEEPASIKATTEPPSDSVRSIGSGRSVVLFVDTLHLSASSLLRAKLALKKFINESLTDRDVALLITSDGTANALAQFTQDKQLLRHLADRISHWHAPHSRFTPYLASLVRRGDTEAIAVAAEVIQGEDGLSLRGLPPSTVRQIVEAKAGEVLFESEHRRRALLSVIRELAERIAALPGQRLILFISDGFTMFDRYGGSDTGDLRTAISKAVRSGAIIYSLDAKGLLPPMEFDASLPSVGGNSTSIARLSGYMSASEKELQNGMNALAADTGGKAFFNTNDIPGALQEVLNDNRIYYLLAYYPVESSGDDKFRRISIRVRNHEDYKVRTPKGYFASDLRKTEPKKESLTPQQKLLNAVARPLPVTDIPITVSTSFLETSSDSSQVSVFAWIDARAIEFQEMGGRHTTELVLAVVVYDQSGSPVSTSSDSIKGNLSDKDLEIAKRAGFRYGRRLQLKPGRYQVRVGVRDADGARIGTASAWVNVPNLSRGQLTLSSIMLTESEPTSEVSVSSNQINPLLGITYFKRGSLLAYNVSIYNVKQDQVRGLLMQSRIGKGTREIYKSEWQPTSARVVARDDKSVTIGGQIRLELDPGIYELRISVKDLKSNENASEVVTIGVSG
jgi:VWFA-related protein